MSPKCHICKSESNFFLEKDGFDLCKCYGCGLVFVYPQPSQNSIDQLYSYESGYQANRAEDLSKIPEFPRVKKVLDHMVSLRPGSNVLDVGCAGGQFMYWAKKRGFEVVGVEVNKRTADSALAQGFAVYNGLIENAPFETTSFDFIFLGEVIEHVSNPRNFVISCSRFLKPGGYLIITTPNLDCFWSKSTFVLYDVFRIPWSSVTPPYHLHQFSAYNLNLLLKQEDFSLVKQDFLLMTKIKYELGMLHLLKRFKKTRRIADLVFMAVSFSLYMILYVVNIVLYPFLKKDFNMIQIYKKS